MVLEQQRGRGVAGALVGAVLAFSISAAPARADIIPLADMLHGTHATLAQCQRVPDAVYVSAYGQSFCIRYFISDAGGQGAWPVVFLQGDKLGTFQKKTMSWTDPGNADYDTTKFTAMAERLSQQTHTTAIYLARMGIDGSSGFHGDRKTYLELDVTNAALDAIKRRYGFAGFHLVGQSGGSMVIAGLLAERQDIGCAVPGSGRMVREQSKEQPTSEAAADMNPIDAVPYIARNRSARILVVTDPRDERADGQVQFVRALRQSGRQVEQFFVQATDAIHHGVVIYSFKVVSECIAGTGSGQISAKLVPLVWETVARAEARARQNAVPAAVARMRGQPFPTRM